MIIIKAKKKPETTETEQATENQEETSQLEEKITEDKDQQIAELTDTLKRLQAEFENYKKRTEKECHSITKNANLQLIKEMLPVLDSFESALKLNSNNPEAQIVHKGIELLYSQLFNILKMHGLRIIETKGKKFDPYKHEVIQVRECDQEDNLILEEYQKGYMVNDMIIRYSKIIIAKKIEEKKTDA